MPVSWKTLFLPQNFPKDQVFSNYIVGESETHLSLVLDYASLFNHHESANAKAEAEKVPGLKNIHVQVRVGFQYAKACTHNHIHREYTKHFQGHKRCRGWTGIFFSVWQRSLVATLFRYALRRCGLRQHNVAAGPPLTPMSPKRSSHK